MDKSEYRFRDSLMKLGVHRDIECQMVDGGFRSIEDFSGLTAERLMVQYPGLKFGTAHRLCLAATKTQEVCAEPTTVDINLSARNAPPTVVIHNDGSVFIIVNGETSRVPDGCVYLRGDITLDDYARIVQYMVNYYGSKTALRNMATRIGFSPDMEPESTVLDVAQGIVSSCKNYGILPEFFRKIISDFDADPEVEQLISRFVR